VAAADQPARPVPHCTISGAHQPLQQQRCKTGVTRGETGSVIPAWMRESGAGRVGAQTGAVGRQRVAVPGTGSRHPAGTTEIADGCVDLGLGSVAASIAMTLQQAAVRPRPPGRRAGSRLPATRPPLDEPRGWPRGASPGPRRAPSDRQPGWPGATGQRRNGSGHPAGDGGRPTGWRCGWDTAEGIADMRRPGMALLDAFRRFS
jgi:hypothetical protein